MEENIEMIKKRFDELSKRSYNKGIFTFTDFLGISDQSALLSMDIPVKTVLFGGGKDCERMMARFGDPEELGYDEPYPIVLLRLSPKSRKFADALTHRDFLGAIMNLGIDRSKVGDIFVEDNCGYVFVHESVGEYVKDSLEFIKHTAVTGELLSEVPDILAPKTEVLELNVASERADAVIASVFNLSRNESSALFAASKVFINSRTAQSDSKVLNEGDRISVRGHGKFIYHGTARTTRKGRLFVEIERYI